MLKEQGKQATRTGEACRRREAAVTSTASLLQLSEVGG